MAAAGKSFDFDVALSFAGEDRPVVEQFATLMRAAGKRVFYDTFEQANLWGKDLYQYLHKVYQENARFCVVFVSAAYVAKAWTRHELKSAQERAFGESQEYILPVLLDETTLPGVSKTVGYIDLRKESVEELVRLMLTKLDAPATSPDHAKVAAASEVFEDSQDWVLLADHFYRVKTVERPDDKQVIVSLATAGAGEDNALEELRTRGRSAGDQLSFAYANDAYAVRCEAVTSSYAGRGHEWRVTLGKKDVQYGGGMMETSFTSDGQHFTGDDFARLRAGRILLGVPATPEGRAGWSGILNQNFIENYIQGNDGLVKVTGSPIQHLTRVLPRDDVGSFLRRARLACLWLLKAGMVVERVERLALGPLEGDSVRVAFRGWRRKKYANTAPTLIEVNGNCLLA
jgi:hypothetical protein